MACFLFLLTQLNQLIYRFLRENVRQPIANVFSINLISSFIIVVFQMSKNDKQTKKIEQFRKEAQKKQNIQIFLRSFEVKQQSVRSLFEIYSRHALTQHFQSTFKAAVALLVIPSLTNIYYALRSQSIYSKIIPFAVPISALFNYFYFLNQDMKKFSLIDSADSYQVRSHYQIIYGYSFFDKNNSQHLEELVNFMQDKKRKKQASK